MKNQHSPWLALAVAAFLFLGINLFSGTALRFWRVDMTEQSLFTLSDGTRNILKKIDEPITIRLFFSTATAEDIPALQTYARRVRELLEEVEDDLPLPEGQGAEHTLDPFLQHLPTRSQDW